MFYVELNFYTASRVHSRRRDLPAGESAEVDEILRCLAVYRARGRAIVACATG